VGIISLGREEKTTDNSPLVMIFNMFKKNGIALAITEDHVESRP
jgi:hypothetical protein